MMSLQLLLLSLSVLGTRGQQAVPPPVVEFYPPQLPPSLGQVPSQYEPPLPDPVVPSNVGPMTGAGGSMTGGVGGGPMTGGTGGGPMTGGAGGPMTGGTGGGPMTGGAGGPMTGGGGGVLPPSNLPDPWLPGGANSPGQFGGAGGPMTGGAGGPMTGGTGGGPMTGGGAAGGGILTQPSYITDPWLQGGPNSPGPNTNTNNRGSMTGGAGSPTVNGGGAGGGVLPPSNLPYPWVPGGANFPGQSGGAGGPMTGGAGRVPVTGGAGTSTGGASQVNRWLPPPNNAGPRVSQPNVGPSYPNTNTNRGSHTNTGPNTNRGSPTNGRGSNGNSRTRNNRNRVTVVGNTCFTNGNRYERTAHCTGFRQGVAPNGPYGRNTGRLYLLQCPQGLHFNLHQCVCDRKERAGCNRNPSCTQNRNVYSVVPGTRCRAYRHRPVGQSTGPRMTCGRGTSFNVRICACAHTRSFQC